MSMDPSYIDYGKLMNNKTFQIAIQEMYNVNLPKYITGIKPPRAMLNGVEVDAEEFNQHPLTSIIASDELVSHDPIQVGSEYDMVISYVTPATIVDFCVNGVVFDIPNDKDLNELIDIMYNYKQQISPHSDKQIVQVYLGQLSQALLILVNNQNRRVERNDRKRAINHGEEQPKSIMDMLGGFF